jgi:hypothetical protein
MSLFPEKVGGGGAPGGRRKPPDQTGNFRKGLDKNVNRRCICCKREGPAVPKHKLTPTLHGLAMLGHGDKVSEKLMMHYDDLRYAPWEARGIEWADTKLI